MLRHESRAGGIGSITLNSVQQIPHAIVAVAEVAIRASYRDIVSGDFELKMLRTETWSGYFSG
jgi:hypothetical protein